MALAFFLGMCTYLAVSKQVTTAVGLGIAVIVVQTITVPINNLIFNHVLTEGALAWAGFDGESDVFGLGHIHRRDRRDDTNFGNGAGQIRSQSVQRLGHIFAPDHGELRDLGRVTADGRARFQFSRERGVWPWAVARVGHSPLSGWPGVREKMKYSNVPPALRGLGITFMTVGLMAMAFMLFSGIQL